VFSADKLCKQIEKFKVADQEQDQVGSRCTLPEKKKTIKIKLATPRLSIQAEKAFAQRQTNSKAKVTDQTGVCDAGQ